MKHEFEIHTSNKVGLDSKEGYIVTRGNTGFLRVLGAEPQWSLLLRPDEVLSGILDAPILEVADDALGVLLQRHHVRTGGLA